MTEAEFFTDIDNRIGAKPQEASVTRPSKENARQATRDFVAQVKPILERYKAQFEQRGIPANLHVAGDSGDLLVFELHYKKGGHYGFQIHDGNVTKNFTEGSQSYSNAGLLGEINQMKPADIEAI